MIFTKKELLNINRLCDSVNKLSIKDIDGLSERKYITLRKPSRYLNGAGEMGYDYTYHGYKFIIYETNNPLLKDKKSGLKYAWRAKDRELLALGGYSDYDNVPSLNKTIEEIKNFVDKKIEKISKKKRK